MYKQSSNVLSPTNIAYVSVGVQDMDAVRRLWVDELGLDIIARREGKDPELGRLWNLPAEQFVDQLLLGTPGAASGRLHFVQFRNSDGAVRSNAASTDLGAKNLDANCTDMPERVDQLRTAGFAFRSAIGEYEIDGIQAREVQMPAHDDVNVVLIEVLSGGFDVNYTDKGFAALTSFVVIVSDVDLEVDFYQRLLGMQDILSHKLSGPAIEMAAGLPSGTVLDLHLLGAPDNLFGRMELIQYVGVDGDNRFERAVPPATGILRCGFVVDSADDILLRLNQLGTCVQQEIHVDAIYGKGRIVEFSSPAGLMLEVMEEL